MGYGLVIFYKEHTATAGQTQNLEMQHDIRLKSLLAGHMQYWVQI